MAILEKNTFRFDGDDREEIDIDGIDIDGCNNYENQKKYRDKTLIFRNCKNLKKIEADYLGLKGIKFEGDCSQLEHLSAYNNKFTELDLTNQKQLTYLNVGDNELEALKVKGCENLKQLSCRNNRLSELVLDLNNDEASSPDLKENTSLTYLNCAYNSIEKLEVTHCKNLKKVFCENNRLTVLDCRRLDKLEELNCSYNIVFYEGDKKKYFGIQFLYIDECNSLWFLDCAENSRTHY